MIDKIGYRYAVSGNDGHIDLIIELERGNRQRLIASFDYITELGLDQKITPATVKFVIDDARKNGWSPERNGKDLRIAVQTIRSGTHFTTHAQPQSK